MEVNNKMYLVSTIILCCDSCHEVERCPCELRSEDATVRPANLRNQTIYGGIYVQQYLAYVTSIN